MTTYEYRPLDPGKLEIRLLTILPGENTDDIHVLLNHVPLSVHHGSQPQKSNSTPVATDALMHLDGYEEDDEEDEDYECEDYEEESDDDDDDDDDLDDTEDQECAGDEMDMEDEEDEYIQGYEALSYVWGSAQNPKSITVDRFSAPNNVISVTENLYVALLHLRLKTKPRVMWIDAVCINQKDEVEKSHQVSIFGIVYRTAMTVIVWLGPEQNDSSYALQLIDELGMKVKVDWNAGDAYPSEIGRHEPHWADTTQELDFGERGFHSIHFLLARSWFERLWIRQEIYLARTATVLCGRSAIPWIHFENAAYCLKYKPFRGSALGELRGKWRQLQDLILDLCGSKYKSESYSALRFTLRGVKWTDPKDAIYAVSNLLHHDDFSLNIKPDYTKSIAQVFEEVAISVLDVQHTLSLLHSCEINNRSPLRLPSWVPDWSTHMRTQQGLRTKWSACGWISAQAQVQTNEMGERILRAAGVRVSTVEKVIPLDVDEYSFDRSKVVSCIKQILHRRSLEGSYVGGGSLLQAYCRTLCACHLFAEDLIDEDTTAPSLAQVEKSIEVLRSWKELPKDLERHVRVYLDNCFESFIGRCFLFTPEGYIGLAPIGTAPGDMLCVFLGCQLPMVLRETSEGSCQWQVVGPCYVPGLMRGEAIHGPLPGHYREIVHTDGNLVIDSEWSALLDQRDGSLTADPAKILGEMGITNTRYQRRPHILDVPPETLRRAGVDLENFNLV